MVGGHLSQEGHTSYRRHTRILQWLIGLGRGVGDIPILTRIDQSKPVISRQSNQDTAHERRNEGHASLGSSNGLGLVEHQRPKGGSRDDRDGALR